MISERVLRKWRGEALIDLENIKNLDIHDTLYDYDYKKECSRKVLSLTQELLDQHLLNKVIRK